MNKEVEIVDYGKIDEGPNEPSIISEDTNEFLMSIDLPFSFEIFDDENKEIADWTDLKYDGNNRLIFESRSKGKYERILSELEISDILDHIAKVQNMNGKQIKMMTPYLDLDVIVKVSKVHLTNEDELEFKLRYAILDTSITQQKNAGFCVRKNDIKVIDEVDVDNLLPKKELIASPNGKNNYTAIKFSDYLKKLLKENPRLSIMVSGETGSGKTELQKYIIGLIHKSMGIVAIQDTNDVALKQHYPDKDITEVYQTKNNSMSDGIRIALRYNPEWIIVSETRGEEVKAYIEALQTGHSGITTIHASGCMETIDRIVFLYNKYSAETPITNHQIASLIDLIIHIEVIYVDIDENTTIKKRQISNMVTIKNKDEGVVYEKYFEDIK